MTTMLYNFLKVIHILSATTLLTSMSYSGGIWLGAKTHDFTGKILTQSWLLIVPCAVFQLTSGFTMISLKHENLNQLWIKGSAIGFIFAIASWFGFVYFLISNERAKKRQTCFLFTCGASLLAMIFFMANKI
jgi:hypothetical protein